MSDKDVMRVTDSGVLLFFCPGCQEYHGVWPKPLKNPATGASWTWNGSFDKPTLSPSVHVMPVGNQPRCHSYIDNGRIQFLNDCQHKLAGTTVNLPPIHS